MRAREAIAASTEIFSLGGGGRKGWERGRGARISRGKGGRKGGRERAEKDVCFKKSGRRRGSYLFAEKTMMETSARLLSRGKERALQNTLQVFFQRAMDQEFHFLFYGRGTSLDIRRRLFLNFLPPPPYTTTQFFSVKGFASVPWAKERKPDFFSPRVASIVLREKALRNP